MGTYNSAVITNGGQSMIAQAVAGASLEFTIIKTSNYAYPAGTNLATLTTINGIKQSKDITSATVYNSRVIKISAAVDNTGISTAYTINTIGIYAKVGSSAESLFAVVTASAADTMPAYSNKPYSYIYEINLTMQNAANVTVTVNAAGLVNVAGLNAARVEIDGEIADLKSALTKYNSINLLPRLSDQTISSSGVTGSVTDDVIVVNGTTSKSLNIRYYNQTNMLPDWWIPGRDVYIYIEKTGMGSNKMVLRIGKYNSDGSDNTITDIFESTVYHIPEDFDGVGLYIKFFIATGRHVDGSFYAYILNTMSNEELTKYINQKDVFTNPPMLTIIDDDGNVGFYTDLLPLVESRGVSISSAVISDRANTEYSTHMTWAQIEDASKRGAEIVNHSFDHLTGERVASMTEQEIWLNYQRARNTLATHGLPGAGYLVYAGASGSYDKAQSAAKHSNKCAFHAGGNTINYRGSFDPYHINRYRVQTDGYDYDPDQLKALIDKCLEEGGWMVWMIHTSETVWTTLNGLAGITAAIDYAIEKGLPVVSVDTGYRTYIA